MNETSHAPLASGAVLRPSKPLLREGRAAHRLVEIDALRGLAALSVVLFHLTTRFVELFQPVPPPSLEFRGGQYGVNLFFIISGFVIFMTLEKTRRPADFVVSRFSRLFPAYWASIATTFLVTHWLGLPGKLVDAGSAMANMLMLHGLFRVPHVDGVYWTLEVELLFYGGMLLMFRLKWLDRILPALFAMLLLRWVYFGAAQVFGVDLPWTIYRLLILQYIPWFALGISIFLVLHSRAAPPRWPLLTAGFAVLTLFGTESLFMGALAVALAALVFVAASGRGPWLRAAPLVWLGSISYPLYLLHENIGWSLELRILALDVPIDVAAVGALAAALGLAALMTRFVERPAMSWIRARYRQRRQAGAA